MLLSNEKQAQYTLYTFSVLDDRIEYISDVLQTLIIDERSAAVLKPNFGKQEQNQYSDVL